VPGNQDDPSETLSLCVRCGRCRSVCPTFELELVETAVARGRVVLAEHLGEGMEPTQGLYRILHTCLLCMACEEVCTNEAPVVELVEAARALLVKERGKPLYKRILARILEDKPLAMRLVSLGLLSRPIWGKEVPSIGAWPLGFPCSGGGRWYLL